MGKNATNSRVIDGADTTRTIMIGSPKLAVARRPSALWWREVKHAEISSVVFSAENGDSSVLDSGVIDHTFLATNNAENTIAVWSKIEEDRAAYIFACAPRSADEKPARLSQSGSYKPTASIDENGTAVVAWSRIDGRTQNIECALGPEWKNSFGLSDTQWASRPCSCVVAAGEFFIGWDELDRRGGSVSGCLIDNRGGARSVTVFHKRNSGVRYINTACARVDRGVLITAVRVEDAVSNSGIVDQYHTIAAALIDVESLEVTALDDVASLDHGLLADPELRTNVWGYLGRRLFPGVLSTGAVWWERKLRHDGFTVTDDAVGVLCCKEPDFESWSAEKVIHRESHLYDVESGPDEELWVLHRPVIQDVTHQLVLEHIEKSDIRDCEESWLAAKGYRAFSFPDSPPTPDSTRPMANDHADEQLQLYWGDAHVHSSISFDPEGEPDEMLHYARDLARLDFVALTDNDSLYTAWLRVFDRVHSAHLADTWSEPGRFVALDGFEYTRPDLPDSHRNHRSVLVRGEPGSLFRWDDPAADNNEIAGPDHRNVDGLKAGAERIDGLLICHHADWVLSDSELETGIEAVSSWDTYIHNAEAIRAEWNRGRRLCLIGGSDGHRRNAGLGGALTGVWARELTREGILQAISHRRTIATQGRRPSIDFRLVDAEGTALFMGDYGHLSGAISAHIEIEVEPGREDRIEMVELLHRERTLASWSSSETHDGGTKLSIDQRLEGFDSIAANQVLKLKDPKYLYLRMRHTGAERQFPSNVADARGPWAWTTPIWWS